MARMQLAPVAFGFTIGGSYTDVTPADLTALGTATGVSFINNGLMVLFIYNADAAATTVTTNIGKLVYGESVTAFTTTVPATKMISLGPWPPSIFTAEDGTGNTYIDINPQTSVSVGLFSLASQQGL